MRALRWARDGDDIGDFRSWKDHDAYQEAFTRLLRDLKAKADRDVGSWDARAGATRQDDQPEQPAPPPPPTAL